MRASKTLIAIAAATVLLAGCKKQDAPAGPEAEPAGQPSDAAVTAGVEPEPAPAAAEAAQPQAAAATGFDINAIAASDKPLGEWPHLAAPAGYTFDNDTAEGTKDLARVPFWTGSQLVWVEGKTYETKIHAGEGKTFSRFEVMKGIDQSLTALGAVKLSDKAPDDATQEANKGEIDSFVQEFEDVYSAFHPSSSDVLATYVIRRADKAIWAVATSNNNSAGLLLADGPLPEPPPAQ